MSQKPAAARRVEFTACLGKGGFGEVYLATMVTSSGLRRQVAVKTLHPELALHAEAVRRLRDEARLLAALNHRAILQVLDLVDLDGRLGLLTEYVEGEDLAALIERGEVPPLRATVEIVGEVAGALDAAWHARSPDTGEPLQLVHRDIKPSNIRLSPTGGVKLLDFGIARSEEVSREARTSTGLVVGTLGYLAPERFTEDGVGPEGDVFALGCVLYELLAGKRLYGGVDKRSLTRQALDPQLHRDFVQQRLSALSAAVPARVRALLTHVLAHAPSDRPTAAALERRCDDLAQQLSGDHLRRWARDRSWAPPSVSEGELVGRTVSAEGLVTGVEPVDGDAEGVVPEGGTHPTMAPGLLMDAPLPSRGRVASGLTTDLAAVAPPEPAARGGLASTPTWLEDEEPPPAVAERPRRGWLGGAALVGGLVALGVAVVLLAGRGEGTADPARGVAELAGSGEAERVEAAPVEAAPVEAAPVEAAPVEAAPVEAAPVEAAQGEAAEPTVTTPDRAGGEPTRADAAAAPVASLARQPAAAAPVVGTVVVVGSVPVALQGAAGRVAPGAVPVGTYQVLADFGAGERPTATVTVGAGETATVRCSSMVLNCTVQVAPP